MRLLQNGFAYPELQIQLSLTFVADALQIALLLQAHD